MMCLGSLIVQLADCHHTTTKHSEMLMGFQEGITPNPDVLCNERIKFGAFLRHALKKEAADCIATGHYARIRCENGGMIWTSCFPLFVFLLL